MSLQGKPLWHEIFTNNKDKTQAFYTELFNWSVMEMDAPTGDGSKYAMFMVGEKPVAGISAVERPYLDNMWFCYMGVDNLDNAIAAVNAEGGKILETVEMANIGKWIEATDPEGALFSAFEAANPEKEPAQDGPPIEGDFCWHELMCNDLDKVFPFYEKLFGWTKDQAHPVSEGAVYQMYSRGGVPMGGLMNMTPEMGCAGPYWTDYIHVADVDGIQQRAVQLGGKVTFEGMNTPDGNGRVGGIIDSNGAGLCLWSPNAK